MRSEQDQFVLPSGVVTFLLTDIEGSTRLWESKADGVATAMRRHHEIVGGLMTKFGGVRPRDQGEGDSLLAVFQSATDAAACAIAIQDALAQEPWPSDIEVRVRISLHSGEPDLRDQHNYMGVVISRAARIRALAAGGQILVSEPTAALLQESLPGGARIEELGSFRLRDLSRSERLFELRYPGAPTFPPLRGANAVINNMPSWLSNYIDRPEEAQAIDKSLSASRLVCVAGPGGCGKTRLALHVASSKVDDFLDGVWVVDLAPVVDETLITQKVAASLGMVGGSEEGMDVGQASPQGTREAVIGFLSERDVLLVLDNCEHLVDPLAELIEQLLNSCPRLKIIATTRESLGLPAEVVYRVPPMLLPSRHTAIQDLADHAAVRLFVERASQVKPAFALDENNARVVAEICERLDGLPLAIELAAAKVKVMSVSDIATRLTDHFRLLTGGSRTALERQQTLRGTVDWSYQHCTAEQRTLLRRLSVFAGGCTLATVEQVAADDDLPIDQILDAIAGLVDKSLLVVDDTSGQARYRMLETIRQFAREKLSETDEVHRIRDAHANHFLGLAESGDFPIHCADEPEAFERLAAEDQNLIAAMEWLISSGNLRDGCRLGWALYMFWLNEGLVIQAESWLKEALAQPDDLPVEVRAAAMAALSRMQSRVDSDAVEMGRQAVEWAERSEDPQILFVALMGMLTLLWARSGSAEVARSEIDELLSRLGEAAARTGKPQLEILSDLRREYLLAERGHFQHSVEALSDILARSRRLGFKRGMAICLSGLADLRTMRDELPLAQRDAEEALGLARSIRLAPVEGQALGILASIHIAKGQLVQAESLALESAELGERLGGRVFKVWAKVLIGRVRMEMGMTEESSKGLESVRRLDEEGSPSVSMVLHVWAGWLALVRGDFPAAVQEAQAALLIAQESVTWEVAGVKTMLSAALALNGEIGRAHELVREGLASARRDQLHDLVPLLLDAEALVSARSGDADRASVLLGCADGIRSRSGRVALLSNRVFRDAAWNEAEERLGKEAFAAGSERGKSSAVETVVSELIS